MTKIARINTATGEVLTIGHGRTAEDEEDIITFEGSVPETGDIEYLMYNGEEIVMKPQAEIDGIKTKKEGKDKEKSDAKKLFGDMPDKKQFAKDSFPTLTTSEQNVMADIMGAI